MELPVDMPEIAAHAERREVLLFAPYLEKNVAQVLRAMSPDIKSALASTQPLSERRCGRGFFEKKHRPDKPHV